MTIFVCAAFGVKIERVSLVEAERSASNRQALARNLLDALLPKSIQAVSSAYGSKEKQPIRRALLKAIRSTCMLNLYHRYNTYREKQNMNSPVAGHCFLKYPSKDERCEWTRIIKVLTDKCRDQGRRSNKQNIHTGIEREEK